MDESIARAVAARFTECLLEGDVEGVDALYHDDVVVWRNIDDRELSKRQVMKVVRFLADNLEGLAYNNIRVRPIQDGYVQQHILSGTAANGQEVNAHACLIVTLEDGRIRRLDEYLDGTQIQALMG